MATNSTLNCLPHNRSAPRRISSSAMAIGAIAALLVCNLPLFLCLPLSNDTVLYDIQAKQLLEGGVLYRELFETNLPGVIWVHCAVRSLLGWSSVAMRAVDFALFSATVLLLCAWMQTVGRNTASRLWVGALLVGFYFSISEWCHCQRDIWLLPIALCALLLRNRQLRRLRDPAASCRSIALWAGLEGLCVAAGFWIKPHIAVPGLVCWLVGALGVQRKKRLAVDFGALLIGGLLAGALGVFWLWQTGAWPFFVETLLDWNPRYVQAGKEHWTLPRFIATSYRLFPWILLHLAAVPLAIAWLVRACGAASRHADGALPRRKRYKAMFAAFYLAWLVQSFALQHLFDYVHVPAIVLALGALAAADVAHKRSQLWKPAVYVFLLIAVVVSPVFRSDRLACWPQCLADGSTPSVRDRLAHLEYPDWKDLQRVAEYLQELQLRDGELTCYHNSLIYLYPMLDLRPSTRYPYLESYAALFPDRHHVFRQALERSPQRFVVTDLVAGGMSRRQATEVGPDGPAAPPPAFLRSLESQPFKGTFPWSHPVVYRSGTILVHRVTSPIGRFVNENSEPRPKRSAFAAAAVQQRPK